MSEGKYVAPISQQVQEQKNKSCFAYVGEALRRFNPCLRPERQSENLTKFLQQYKEVSLYEDPYFGEVFLLQSLANGQQLLMKKEKMYESQAGERQQQIKQIESYKSNPHIVSQVLIQKINKLGFLWAKVEMYLVYDFIIFDLHKQFEYRLTKGTNFTDREITSIIKGACKGYIGLQPTDYSSIRMSYIYFTRKGTVKVAHPNLFRYKTNLEQICEYDESKGIYLSPEEMYCLEKGQKGAILGWKSNYFVFGMVILSLMSHTHLNQVYDYSACYIDRTKIEQLLRNCRQIYPQKLVNLVEKLIEQRPEDRLTFRNLLNQLSYTTESHQEVQLELLNEATKPVQVLPYGLASNLAPIRYEQETQHTNYLAGLVYPKIGRAGEFYNENKLATSHYQESRLSNRDETSIVAEQRHFYQNKNSSYIGEGKYMVRQNSSASNEKPYREGKGYYQNHDGQLYLGDWVKGQMEGYGKLYWDEKRIRYEGEFKAGKFHGRGVQYNGDSSIVGKTDKGDEPDQNFVRMQRDNWQKYEGNFVGDKRQGQGIVFFKTGKWIGNFKEDQPSGHGVFIDNQGKQTKGVWRDGILQ